MKSNIDSYFQSTYLVQPTSFFDPEAVQVKNIEVVITRVPGRSKDGYSLDMVNSLTNRLKESVVDGGFVFLICYGPIECRWRPFEISKVMCEKGFNQIDNIIIRKSWNSGKRTEHALTNNYEYVLFFINGKARILDKRPLRKYFGTPEEETCIGNVWDIKDTTLNDSISYDLSNLLIKLTNILPGSTIMNPFGGSVHLLKAAIELGHSYYSWEPNPRNYQRLINIIKKNNLLKNNI